MVQEPTRCRDARGQVVPLVAALVVAAAATMVLLAALGGVANDRARARTAADAAALAGAAAGEDAAADQALANGGVLESFAVRNGQTEVVVRVGHARATSRAVISVLPTGSIPEGAPVLNDGDLRAHATFMGPSEEPPAG